MMQVKQLNEVDSRRGAGQPVPRFVDKAARSPVVGDTLLLDNPLAFHGLAGRIMILSDQAESGADAVHALNFSDKEWDEYGAALAAAAVDFDENCPVAVAMDNSQGKIDGYLVVGEHCRASRADIMRAFANQAWDGALPSAGRRDEWARLTLDHEIAHAALGLGAVEGYLRLAPALEEAVCDVYAALCHLRRGGDVAVVENLASLRDAAAKNGDVLHDSGAALRLLLAEQRSRQFKLEGIDNNQLLRSALWVAESAALLQAYPSYHSVRPAQNAKCQLMIA